MICTSKGRRDESEMLDFLLELAAQSIIGRGGVIDPEPATRSDAMKDRTVAAD
jgi:hypothetical protein